MKKKYLLLIVLITGINLCSAQDIHFSQYMNTPYLVNPGLTGIFEGDIRASLQYKDQWNSWNNAFKTYALSFEVQLLKNSYNKGKTSIGINLYNDEAGSANFNTSFFNMSLSNIFCFNEKNSLSAGFNFGYYKRSILFNKLQWGSQYDADLGYNSILPTNETNLLNNNKGFDLSAGLVWQYSDNKPNEFNMTFGMAMYHLNYPNKSFSADQTIDEHYRVVIHSCFNIPFNENNKVEPSAYYIKQGPQTEILMGSILRTNISNENSMKINGCELIYGGYYRVNDAIIALAGININNYQLTISYDINISELKTASNYKGGLEIGLKFTTPNPFNKNNQKFIMGDKRI